MIDSYFIPKSVAFTAFKNTFEELSSSIAPSEIHRNEISKIPQHREVSVNHIVKRSPAEEKR